MINPRPNISKLEAVLVEVFQVSEGNAKFGANQYLNGYDAGREQGRKDAQEYLQLMLGIKHPTTHQSAYWNNPFPLLSIIDTEETQP